MFFPPPVGSGGSWIGKQIKGVFAMYRGHDLYPLISYVEMASRLKEKER
jgi:hypothetical protein